MRFGSVCSGIEAASVAWHPLGWEAAWLAEIEPFPSAVLAHHYPDVPNLGDMTTITRRVLTGEVEAPDVFTGGTPCQAFSVAGLRRSLDDARGNLSLTFCEIADAIDHVRVARGDQPAIIVWENVPGVLSTADNAFGCFLAGLAGEDEPLVAPGGKWTNAGVVHGPTRSVAWRTLDAQYFGVAQRRRRVWVVASARAGVDPAAVLFEWDRVRRDSAPSREPGKDTAGSTGDGVARCVTAGEMKRQDWETCTMVAQPVAFDTYNQTVTGDTTQTLCSRGDSPGGNAHLVPAIAFHPTQDPISSTDGTTHAMGTGSKGGCATVAGACIHADAIGRTGEALTPSADAEGRVRLRPPGMGVADDGSAYNLMASGQPHGVASGMAVRRLTPRECERLQGFPDDYTAIPWRGKPAGDCPDGPRYKALGNSWAVPCAAWIGRRIALAFADQRAIGRAA